MKPSPPVALITSLLLSLSTGIVQSAEMQPQEGGRTVTAKMPATARIKSMDAGDRACYVTLEDRRGKKYEDLADFEVCEQKQFIGKWVTITRKKALVMSAACEGRDDCTLSDTVNLITSVKTVR